MMVASAAVTGATALVSSQAQANMARGQNAAIADNFYANDADLQARGMQQADAATQQASERAVQAIRERGHILAAQADSGVEGNSVERTLNESAFIESQDQAAIRRNAATEQFQTLNERNAQVRTANQQIAAIQRPSQLGTALQIIGGITSAGANYYAGQPRAPGG